MTAHPSAVTDVLVVGGGPAGAAASIRLAERGHRVTILERERVPRTKTCGELISPRAVTALGDLGVSVDEDFHRIDHVRFTYEDHTTSTSWPQHDDYADHAVVAPRDRFDEHLVRRACELGATLLDGHEATAPIVERGFVRGANVRARGKRPFELRATYTVVADGANSRFGRALGTFREPSWTYALAHRGLYRSVLHSASEAEFVVDLRDRAGTPITGFGWMFPRGDGTVNVGVLLMSSSPSFQVLSPAHVLERFVAEHANRWHLGPDPIEPPAGGRVPMGNSIDPVAGPTYLVAGDAAGAANPMTGSGIDYGLETGLLAGDVLDEALETGSAGALQHYPQDLRDRYGSYFQMGRFATRILSQPAVNTWFAQLLVERSLVTNALLRVVTNELRAGHAGPAELAYRLGRAVSTIAPEA